MERIPLRGLDTSGAVDGDVPVFDEVSNRYVPGRGIDPTTTKGDIAVRGASALSRLPVGADGQVLSADSTQDLGVRWVAALSDLTTTKGDLLARGADALIRVGVGADGQVLTADSASAAGVKWATPAAGGGGTVTPAIRTRTSGFAAAGASFPVTIPATAQVGDLLVLMVGSNSQLETVPAGWALAQPLGATSWHTVAILTRVCQVGDAGSSFTYTLSTGAEGGVWYCVAIADANRILDIGAAQIGPGGTGATTISARIAAGGPSFRALVMGSSRQTSGAVALAGGTSVEARSDSTCRSGIFTLPSNLPQRVTITAPGAPGMGVAYLTVTS